MTWILVFMLYAPGSGVALALDHVPGFKSASECRAAGDQVLTLNTRGPARFAFTCVSQRSKDGWDPPLTEHGFPSGAGAQQP
jgi:hypothetical protein